VAGDQIVGIDLLQGRDDLSDVVVIQRGNDMEAPDNGVDVLDARDDLRLPDRVERLFKPAAPIRISRVST
jgi:hypothetical protein